MIANRNSEQCYPLTWVGRVPVYLATVLAAVQAVSMILTSFAMAVSGPEKNLLEPLIFTFGGLVWNWEVWTIFSYAFVNPPDIMFAIQLIMFAMFGSEVEKYIGRKSFAWMCGLLLVAFPAFLCVLGMLGVNAPYQGAGALNFSVFLAFVLIYPRAQIFFGIEARWIAIVLMAVYSLICLAGHAWAQLAMLWWGLAVVAIWLKFEGLASLETPSVSDFFKRKHSQRKLKVVRGEKPKPKAEEPGVHDSIDPILEKIARQGIGSLSRAEREKLERARTALLEKEREH
jgi:hypothetical protein